MKKILALRQFNVLWDWPFCPGMWVAKDYTFTGDLNWALSPTLLTETVILAKDKHRFSDAARCEHQKIDCASLRNLLVVSMCQEVINNNLNAKIFLK